ncbi:MAG: ankyrin repeat domain-containing protein [Candidatus Binatia bacterium]
MTALHHAAAQNHPEAVKKLIALGASVDARNDDGGTPLDLASILGNDDVIEWLAKDDA